MIVRGNQAASHADHAAEGGGEGVRLRQCLHRCIGPVIHKIRGGKKENEMKGELEGQSTT